MNKIQNAIKCVLCREILELPVILPCNDIVCEKHVSNQINDDFFKCEKCGIDHRIPTNGFQPVIALQEIIDSQIGNLDFGSVHKEAKRSCESFEEALKEFKVLLKDPYVFAHEIISELKNSVQLKGEELKLRIDQETKRFIDELEEYESESKDYILTNEFSEKSKMLENELELAQSNLDSWLESLSKIKFDEENWKSIIEESDQQLKNINEELLKFKNRVLLNKFEVNRILVYCFKSIKFDSFMEYVYVNWDFLESKIIDENSHQILKELLNYKDLDDRNWSLLYRGSRDGFRSYDFHYHCDDKPNTLTLVKSTNGNIFGGFTRAEWKSTGSFEQDNSAFLFSLVNKENNLLLFEKKFSSDNYDLSICFSSKCGPIFGGGQDICISDSSNTNTDSYSNLGYTYTHPEYPYESERAKTILAGTYYFQIEEIEVYEFQE